MVENPAPKGGLVNGSDGIVQLTYGCGHATRGGQEGENIVTLHNWTMKHTVAVVVITLVAVGAFLFSWT
jgi:hypothetical protein